MSAEQRILTGITTTGSPHLGNYVGAIRPAIAASRKPGITSFYFLADYHALIKCTEPKRIQESTLEIAATWLALGLDPDKVYFYRQSDIPEIPELTWLLTCVTAKGLLNRAHAYKAATDANRGANEDPDAGINAGLYMYPVLMAADILMFNANRVPVGRDQVQHIEMARDIAQRYNHIYGDEYFALPQAVIEDSVATLPGLDGRKMSKSYNNTIPLWLPEKELKKKILGIVTNSLAPGEPKNPDESNIFTIYQAFATVDETTAMREAFRDGIAWGEAKQKLFERVNAELGEARERYMALVAKPQRIEEILQQGGDKARVLAKTFIKNLREVVGLRQLTTALDEKQTFFEQAAAHHFGKSVAAPVRCTNPIRSTSDQTFYFKLYYCEDEKNYFLADKLPTARDAGLLKKQLESCNADQILIEIVVREDSAIPYELLLRLDGKIVARGDGRSNKKGAEAERDMVYEAFLLSQQKAERSIS